MRQEERINFRLSSRLLERMDKAAAKMGVDRSEFIRAALTEKVEATEKHFALQERGDVENVKDTSGTYDSPSTYDVNISGHILLTWRAKFDLTQSDLARQAGISRQTVSRLEEGKTQFLRNDSQRKIQRFFAGLQEEHDAMMAMRD